MQAENMSGVIELLDHYPLPLEQWAVDDLLNTHPYFESVGELSVDEFHERYVDELERNGEWVAFKWTLGTGVYIWNHAIGGGIRIEEDESYQALVNLFE